MDFPIVPLYFRTPEIPAQVLRSKSYVSCRSSTGVPRNSSVTISTMVSESQSITIYANPTDLIPTRAGTLRSLNEGPATKTPGRIHDRISRDERVRSVDSMSSFGFDEDVPDPVLVRPHGAASTLPQASSYGPFRSIWRSKSTLKPDNSLYAGFPRPPSKILLQISNVFPEMPPQKPIPITTDKSLPPPPYHVFDKAKKKRIMYIAAIMGMITPLSTLIYFPVLGDISKELRLSPELILLTITVHMVIYGIAPIFWTPLSDYFGRRAVLIAKLVVFVGANAWLLFAENFLSLMLLRAAQAFGAANLACIGVAVIGDISTGEERAALLSVFGPIIMFSQLISPLLGAVLTHFFDFYSIFWFQSALGSLAFLLILLLLPETLRNIAGNGTLRLRRFQEPLITIIESSRDAQFDSSPSSITINFTLASFIEPFHWLSRMDVLGSIIFGAMVLATSAVIFSTTALLLESRYGLSTLLVGVAFLPSGAGSVLGFGLASLLLDKDYKFVEGNYRTQHSIQLSTEQIVKENLDFPIERARLRNMWWIAFLFIGSTIGYGFSLSTHYLAIPLILQFLASLAAATILILNGVLIADLCHGSSASVTTVVNLVRFCLGALAVGLAQLLFDRIGTSYTFLMFAMLTLVLTPILVLQWMFGVKWRMQELGASEESLGTRLKGSFNGVIAKLSSSQRYIWDALRVKTSASWERISNRTSSGWSKIGESNGIEGTVRRMKRALARFPDYSELWGRMRRRLKS